MRLTDKLTTHQTNMAKSTTSLVEVVIPLDKSKTMHQGFVHNFHK